MEWIEAAELLVSFGIGGSKHEERRRVRGWGDACKRFFRTASKPPAGRVRIVRKLFGQGDVDGGDRDEGHRGLDHETGDGGGPTDRGGRTEGREAGGANVGEARPWWSRRGG